MNQLLGLVCVASFIAVLVALALYGAGKLFRGVFGASSPGIDLDPSAGRLRACPQCKMPMSWDARRCTACGWLREPQGTAPLAALDTTAQQLEQLLHAGLLDAATHERVLAAIDAQRQRLAAAAATSTKAVTPLASTVPPAHPASAAVVDVVVAELIVEPAGALGQAVAASAPADVDPSRRVRETLARQHQEAAARAAKPREPKAPKPPRRPFSQLLAAFLEEKNIRWGELVGGLLIVGGSIALVLSFWAQIAEQPMLKFGVFNGVTAGLFGIGFFIMRRWKLPTTGQGLLLISTLLVPLDMLAIAAIAQTAGTAALAGEAVSIAIFGWLVYLAGRVLVERWPVALVAGVVGPSIAELIIAREVDSTTPLGALYLLAALPLACYLAATVWAATRMRHEPQLGEPEAAMLNKLLGLTSFAALLPIGLLAFRTGRGAAALGDVAPLVSLAGGPALATGLLISRRVIAPALVTLRTAGTAIGAMGALVMVIGVACAWPQPAAMLATGLLCSALLASVALVIDVPLAWLLAAPCLALAWLAGWHVTAHHVGWKVDDWQVMANVLLSANSGTALVPLVALLGGAAAAQPAGIITLGRRREHAQCLGWSAVGAAAASLALVTWFGFGQPGDPARAAWVYAIYAAAALAAGTVTRDGRITWLASGLALASLTQYLAFNYPVDLGLPRAIVAALLTHASLATLVAIAGVSFSPKTIRRSWFADPLCQSAMATSLIGAIMLPWAIPLANETQWATHLFWLATVWLALACLRANSITFTAFQAALTLGVVFAVAANLAGHDWYRQSQRPWLDPWSLQTQGIALSILSLIWIGLRIAVRRLAGETLSTDGATNASRQDEAIATATGAAAPSWREAAARFLFPPWPTVDRIVSVVVLVVAVLGCIYAAVPGVAQELSPRLASATAERLAPRAADFALAGLPHEHAQGFAGWLLLVVVTAVLIASLWERFEPWAVQAMLLVLAAACPLAAAHWDGQVSAASALRWLATGYLALGSLPIWFRGPLARWCGRLGWPEFAPRASGLAATARTLVLTLAIVPLVAMAVYTGAAAVARVGLSAEPAAALVWLSVLFVVAAVISALLKFVPAVPAAAHADSPAAPSWPRQASTLAVLLGAAPLVAMTLYVVAVALKQSPILGPEPGSFFARVGLAISYAVPVLVAALVLVGHAVRERSAGFAFAAGLIFNVGATAGYLLAMAGSGLRFDAPQWARLAQLNAAVSAAFALAWTATAWLAVRRRARGVGPPVSLFSVSDDGLRGRARVSGVLLSTQAMLGAALSVIVLVWAGGWFFIDPRSPSLAAFCDELAAPWGWAAFGLALTAFAAHARARSEPFTAGACCTVLMSLGVLIACDMSRAGYGQWVAYRGFLSGHVAVAWLVVVAGWPFSRRSQRAVGEPAGLDSVGWFTFDRRAVVRWASTVGTIAVVVALRDMAGDPQAPWWSVGVVGGMALLAVALACWSLKRRYLYVAGVLVNLATSLWWVEKGYQLLPSLPRTSLHDFVEVNIVALALPCIGWLWIELRLLRPALAGARFSVLAFHRVAASISLTLVVMLVAWGLADDVAGNPQTPHALLCWLALAAAATAIGGCLWDERAKASIAGLYLLGLAAVGLAVDGFNLSFPLLRWTGTMILAAYSLGTSYLWSRRDGLRVWARLLRMPAGSEGSLDGLTWLVPANFLLATAVIALAFAIDLATADVALRLLAAKAAVVQALAVGLLARGRRRSRLQAVSLVFGVFGAVCWGWAWLDPATTGTFLNRAVVATVALAAMTGLYGLGPAKLFPGETDWTRAARRLLPALVATSACSLALVLTAECWYYRLGPVPIAAAAIAAVAAALVGLATAALVAAAVPGRDPLELSERGRTAYVYGAEVLLALLILHIRLTRPEWFHGFFERYWPFVVMFVAFLGAGLAELFRRQRRMVLAEPLERTGAFLPLLPLLGFGVVGSDVGYSQLLLTVGALYAGLSITRRSFAYGVLSALAANAALWCFFRQLDGWGLFEHPQLWMIPPALSLLAAAWINRERLSERQQTTIRYLASSVIYASSTADVFLNSVAQVLWLSVVLAGLSVAGILAGIALRVRAFLFLGLSFLVLSLGTIIWHAAVDLNQMWLLWLALVVGGFLILALFGLFERKRHEVLRLVEGLKEWKA